ncbi:hypothetical protein [Patulibacter sp.]|uniref:hypothetical protein n=1 Tax=Patulibacter sp. TaxID=1912859 RepID=UPI00271FF9F4|nr:hypothetical protein [Patulibacter sp.]MDO9407010.1 hypothetical protein [Patulibacter sp.]
MTLRRPPLALVLGVLSIVVAGTAVLFASAGPGTAAPGLRASTTPKARGVVRLDRSGRFPASVVPTVARARTALRLGSLRAQDALLRCPTGAAELGTWCLDRGVRGVAPHAEAARSCVRLGGRLPTAAQLVGAAERLRLSGRADDRDAKALVDPGGRRDLREMSSTLVTTTTGSAASGGFENPAPATLQYVTVFDNGNAGGFAGGVPTGSAERFRCAFLRRQTAPAMP